MDRQVATNLRAPTRLPAGLSCPGCQSERPKPSLLTLDVAYYRCEDCGEMWTVEKPVQVPERF
jgi:hypothetical protein